jgi:hypothetical protein
MLYHSSALLARVMHMRLQTKMLKKWSIKAGRLPKGNPGFIYYLETKWLYADVSANFEKRINIIYIFSNGY